ncbi:hypothetical protein PR002_g26302 [Phytophthora rubi]|uniref:Uncharacterized protein n=1 Tax=Phytophthora rubi TaxID=129364 RepID=A0A6A3HSY2_9STRA|nr:hypothetical protein PR002_g26302 [Phytophthora rubi]
MDQLLLDVGLDANAAVAAIIKVLKVGLVTDAAAIMTAELLWNLTHRVLLDVELDAASTADVMSELLETQGCHDALTITEDAPEAQTPAPTVMPEDE